MAFSTKEQEIIKYGQQNGKTSQEIQEAISNLRLGIIPQKKEPVAVAEPTLAQNIGNDFNQRADRLAEIWARPTDTKTKLQQSLGQGAGGTANIIEQTTMAIPGVKQVVGVMGEGMKWLQDTPVVKAIGDKLGSVPAVQDIVELYDTDPNFKDTVDGAANLARLGMDVQTVVDSATFAKNVTSKLADKVSSKVATMELPTDGLSKAISSVQDTAPANIMQRVARISKGKQAKFENVAGESVGEYLTKRGIFGNIDEITSKLYDRFTTSKNTADKAFESLTGRFSPTPVRTALEQLLEREKRVSSPGAVSPNLYRTQELLNKINKQGLDMTEINEAKRLFERNIKMDYLKSASTNPEGVVKATNLDSAIRKWQYGQAETLGLKNLPDINRETRLAKQLLDDLGTEYAGSAGNNALGLTDWIMLSGNSPEAIAGFLVKKGFSSKTAQSMIAKFLNRGKEVLGDVKADIGTSKVLQLPAGGETKRILPSGDTIKIAPETSVMESTSKTPFIQGSSKKISPQLQARESQTYVDTIPQSGVLSKVDDLAKTDITKIQPKGGLSIQAVDDMGKPISTADQALISQAKKMSKEEFIKAQGTPVYRGTKESFEPSKMTFDERKGQYGLYVTKEKKFAENYLDEGGSLLSSGTKSKRFVDELVIDKNAKIIDRKDLPKKFLNDYEGGEIKELSDLKKFGGALGIQKTIAKWAKTNGYDVVDFSGNGKNVIVLNPNVVKTKSQLSSIWEKAQANK